MQELKQIKKKISFKKATINDIIANNHDMSKSEFDATFLPKIEKIRKEIKELKKIKHYIEVGQSKKKQIFKNVMETLDKMEKKLDKDFANINQEIEMLKMLQNKANGGFNYVSRVVLPND